ncbi:MAG: hypothetical protein ACNA7I_07005 [Candidatus Methanoperedens sp.]
MRYILNFFIPERKAELDNAVIQREEKIRVTGICVHLRFFIEPPQN